MLPATIFLTNCNGLPDLLLRARRMIFSGAAMLPQIFMETMIVSVDYLSRFGMQMAALSFGLCMSGADASADSESARGGEQTIRLELMQGFALLNAINPPLGLPPGGMPARMTVIFKNSQLQYVSATKGDPLVDESTVLSALNATTAYAKDTSDAVAKALAARNVATGTKGFVVVDLGLGPMGCTGRCLEHKAMFDDISKRLENAQLIHVELTETPTPLDEG